MTAAEVGYWFGFTSNTNLYDNVLAFYSMYYRSGIDTYLEYARTLADRWWTTDRINQGNTCDSNGLLPCFSPRNRSLTGLVLRAVDGRPEMWPGIRELVNKDIFLLQVVYDPQAYIYDLREYAAIVNEVALCAMFDPDNTQKSTCRNALIESLAETWGPKQSADGSWLNPTYGYGYAAWNGQPGTVNVANGSTTVTGAGTNFTPGNCRDQFWNKSGPAIPADNSGGDSVAYSIVSVDSPTQLTISPAYAGATAAGRYPQCNNLVGAPECSRS